MSQNDPQWQILPKKWVRLAPNTNFDHFACFSIFSPKRRLRLTRNGQFHPIHNFSHLLPPKHLIFGEISKIIVLGRGTSANFLSFSSYWNCFAPERLKMTHNGKFCLKNGLDWLKRANFCHFAGFSILFPKMRLRLTQNGQFHLIHNFSHLLPPKHLIFGEISKIFIPVGGTLANFWVLSTLSNCFTPKWLKMSHNGEFCQKSGFDWLQTTNFGHCCMFFHLFPQNEAQMDPEWPIFFEFFNFFESFHTEASQNDPQWQILPKKWLRLAQKSQFLSFCRFFHLFPQNEAQIDSEWPISPDSQLFSSFATKASHFRRNLQNFCSWGGGYISKYFEFFNFFELFHTEAAQNDPQWPILPLKWLRLAQNGQFWFNFNKNLNILVES